MIDDEQLAVNVAQLRKASGLSQDGIARRMQERGHPWHQTTVAKTEANARQIRLLEGVSLAEVFGVSLDMLIGLTPEVHVSRQMLIDQQIRSLRSLSDDIRAALAAVES